MSAAAPRKGAAAPSVSCADTSPVVSATGEERGDDRSSPDPQRSGEVSPRARSGAAEGAMDADAFARLSGATPAQLADLERFRQMLAA